MQPPYNSPHRGVFNWFTSILKDTPLSRSLGQLLSSIFYIKPSFFPQALEWMGLLRLDRGHDDSHQTTDAPESPPRCSVILHNLSKASLSSLSLICKTPACLSFLQTSGFVAACCLFIKDFFERRPPTAAGDHNDHKGASSCVFSHFSCNSSHSFNYFSCFLAAT